jgi:hypothetical protein
VTRIHTWSLIAIQGGSAVAEFDLSAEQRQWLVVSERDFRSVRAGAKATEAAAAEAA